MSGSDRKESKYDPFENPEEEPLEHPTNIDPDDEFEQDNDNPEDAAGLDEKKTSKPNLFRPFSPGDDKDHLEQQSSQERKPGSGTGRR